MSAAANRPNFFILLELDPDAPWNPTDFDIRLKEKQNQWAREANSPKPDVKSNANRNLKLVGEIRTVMADPNKREQEARAYRTAVEAARAPLLRQFEEDLIDLRGEGVTPSLLQALFETYKGVLTEQEIRSRLASEGIIVGDAPQPAAPPVDEPLDAVVAEQIQKNLSFLNEPSLYTLLSKAPGRSSGRPLDFSSPSSEMLEAAKLLSEWTFQQINAGPEVTAKRALTGQAQSIFKDENRRKQYDTLLRRQPLEQLIKRIDRLCTPLGGISPQRAELFLRKAVEGQVQLEEAAQALTRLIATKGWPQILLGGPTEAVQRLHPCANCHRLNDPSDQFCKWCKEALWIDCPNCGTKHQDASVLSCGTCGFALTRRRWVVWALDETERLIGRGEWYAAAEQLDEIRRDWAPKHPDDLVAHMDMLDTRIQPERERINKEREEQRKRDEEQRRKEQERLEAERAARDAAVTAIEASLQARRLYEAQRTLVTAPRATPEHPEYGDKLAECKTTIDEGIARAERLVKLAHASGDDEEAERHCGEALEVAADCAEALSLLAKLPVAAPRNFRVEAVSRHEVRLTWEEPSSSLVSGYTIRRKVGSPPARHDDGELVEMPQRLVTATVDTRAEQGVPIHYSIFSRAGTRYSRLETRATLLAPPVTGLACEVTPASVHLRWELPSPHIRGVRVRRAEGEPPRTIEDGEEVPGATRADVTDRNVREGTRYGYAVFAEYAAVSGRPVWSPAPATIHAMPQMPPRPITDLRAERDENLAGYAKAVLSCTPPQSGELFIVQYFGSQVPRPGSVDRWDALEAGRRVLPARHLPVLHAWTEPGACWYVPVVCVEDMGYVGAAVRFDCVNQVARLRSEVSGPGALRLRWSWPRLCTRVEVASSPTGWPAGFQGVTRMTVARPASAADDSEGTCELRSGGAAELFVAVVAYARAGSQEIASEDLRLRAHLGQRPRLIWKVEKKLLGGAPRALILELRDSTIAPALMVVSQQGRPARDPHDGIVFYKQESMEWRTGKLSVDLKGGLSVPDTFISVFLTDPSEAAAVENAASPLRLA